MKILRHTSPSEPAAAEWSAAAPRPESCPWCGQQRVRGIIVPSNDHPQYRCAACGTTFFVHTPTPRVQAQRRSPR
jgi:transposase-like protein